MSGIEARNPVSPFDAIMGEDGRWSARDLQGLMGYSRWNELKNPLTRAMATARNQGYDVEMEFSHVKGSSPIANLGRNGHGEDYRLSRFASYLLAMNGDPNKSEVASAQAYFATKTRQAELAEQTTKSPLELLRDQVDLAIAHEKRINALEHRQHEVETQVASIHGGFQWYSVKAYANLHKKQADRTTLQRVGMHAGKLLRLRGQVPGKVPDAVYGQVNSYPEDVLNEAFCDVLV